VIEALLKGEPAPLFKSKTKLISFRISEEELSTFRQVCASEGFASLSDLTRTAIQEFIATRSGGSPSGFERELGRLDALIEKLDRAVRELTFPATSPLKSLVIAQSRDPRRTD
jgi:hypothetical protein